MIALLVGCVATVPALPHDSPADTADSDSEAPLPTFDCAAVPDELGPAEVLDGPRGQRGLVFTLDDELVGGDDTKLYRATSPDDAEVWVPGVGSLYQMVLLPDGDLVAVRPSGGLLRVAPSGGSQVFASDLVTYDVVLGSDGELYTAGRSGIHRVDPESGDVDRVLGRTLEPRSLQFSPDESALYFGTEAYGGSIWRVDLDEDQRPDGDPEPLVEQTGGWTDDLEVDACGNVYFISWFGWSLSRVGPDGQVTVLREWDEPDYGHALLWGVGDWGETELYIAHPYVSSLVTRQTVGVPHRSWRGEALGGSTL